MRSDSPWRPSQPIAACCAARQRLRDEHVVVDGHDVAADRADERRERARGQQRVAGEHAAGGRLGAHPRAVAGERRHRRPLVDLRARGLGGARQPPAQPHGIHERGRPARLQPAEERRRVDLRAHRGAIEQLGLPAEPAQRLGLLLEPRQLVLRGRDRDLPRLAPVAVDPVALDRGADPGQVLAAHPLELRQLVRPAREAVADPVGQRGGAEAAVAARGAEGEPLALEQDDALALLRRLQRAPQAREPAADHDEVGLGETGERRPAVRAGLVEPERRHVGCSARGRTRTRTASVAPQTTHRTR